MELLTADKAKELVHNTYSGDLEKIIKRIIESAKEGKYCLHIYEPLKNDVLDKLIDLGYDIPPTPSIAIQRDGLYHTIHWA